MASKKTYRPRRTGPNWIVLGLVLVALLAVAVVIMAMAGAGPFSKPTVTPSPTATSTVPPEVRFRSIDDRDSLTSELDSSGSWVDGNSDGEFDVFIWVKNVGTSKIDSIGQSDVFFGDDDSYGLIPYVDDAGGYTYYWEYEVRTGSEWGPTDTIEVEISYTGALSQGTYQAKFITPSAVSDEDSFTL